MLTKQIFHLCPVACLSNSYFINKTRKKLSKNQQNRKKELKQKTQKNNLFVLFSQHNSYLFLTNLGNLPLQKLCKKEMNKNL